MKGREKQAQVEPRHPSMQLCESGAGLLVTVQGEMDLDWERTNGSDLRAALNGALSSVVFELSDVTFVDSSGLGVMAYAVRAAPEGTFLIGAGLRIRHVIAASGLLSMLTIAESWADIPGWGQRSSH
jgi:anti-anti-sigma factor